VSEISGKLALSHKRPGISSVFSSIVCSCHNMCLHCCLYGFLERQMTAIAFLLLVKFSLLLSGNKEQSTPSRNSLLCADVRLRSPTVMSTNSK